MGSRASVMPSHLAPLAPPLGRLPAAQPPPMGPTGSASSSSAPPGSTSESVSCACSVLIPGLWSSVGWARMAVRPTFAALRVGICVLRSDRVEAGVGKRCALWGLGQVRPRGPRRQTLPQTRGSGPHLGKSRHLLPARRGVPAPGAPGGLHGGRARPGARDCAKPSPAWVLQCELKWLAVSARPAETSAPRQHPRGLAP